MISAPVPDTDEPAAPPAGHYIAAAGSRTAASLLLLRDGESGALEVLMLRRAEREADARSGVAVFPGGVLDARDREAHRFCHGLDDVQASARLGVASGGLDYLVAALRETFEEVGLLLADGLDQGFAAGAIDPAALHLWRDRLQDGSATMAELCTAFGLRFDLTRLAYYSHWLTPPGTPKRFDTRFFAALAPPGQVAQADMGEAVELMWTTPQAALDKARGLKLLPVTRRTLTELHALAQRCDAGQAAAQVLQAIRQRADIPLVMPRRCVTARGGVAVAGVVLPDEFAYAEVARLDPDGRGDSWADLAPGRAVRLSLPGRPAILRVTAPNPGPMTGPGTNSYLVGGGADGSGDWTVIDPGPDLGNDNTVHTQALLDAAAPGRITLILVTHTHRDHSPGAVALARATGAAVLGRTAAFAEWQDPTFAPSRELQHGEAIAVGPGCTLRVIHTPGHASNHLCYLLQEDKLLFTGDHVMQGSTVVLNPPDGDMQAYLAALQGLLDEDIDWFAPGHGFLVAQPKAVVRALIAHRLKRQAKVLAAVLQQQHGAQTEGHDGSIDSLLPRVYDDVPAALHAMARRSLLAHLLKLQADGVLRLDGARWSAV